MIVTTIWGTPTPETAWRIPALAVPARCSAATAQRLRARLARGPLPRAARHAGAHGLDADPASRRPTWPGRHEDRFLLFSGHVDSWHHGAMDNGTRQRDHAGGGAAAGRRIATGSAAGIRFAFWSGHSHGRYAGSAWYADHAWRELHQRCVLHLNVDSTGARGATDYSVLHATEDAQRFAETVGGRRHGPAEPRPALLARGRPVVLGRRACPSAFMSLSGLPDAGHRVVADHGAAGRAAPAFRGGGTREDDTIDKIDADVLVLDTRVYLASALRWLQRAGAAPRPRHAPRAAAGRAARACRRRPGCDSTWRPRWTPPARSSSGSTRLAAVLGRGSTPRRAGEADTVNRGLMRLSRLLVPLAYTSGDRFTHDLALPLARRSPGCSASASWPALDPETDAFKFARAALVRERNRARSRPRHAASAADDLCAHDRTGPAEGLPPAAARLSTRLTSQRMRPTLRSRLLMACLVLGLAAALVSAADAQKRGGTLTIVRPTDPVSLDPNLETTAPGAWVYFNMLEGLLTLDDKMQVKPALATSYEVMSPTKVRFKLRPGVKFHDGTPFNAAAVKFTFDRALRGTPPARWASLAGSLDGAEVVDDLTVDVVTKEPYGPMLRTLAMYCMGIVSPTAVGKMGADFSRAPVGTGPFKFVEWKTNTHVIIERNPDYWGDKALVDRVVFKVVPEEGARMIALQTGDADMVLFPSPAQLPALRKDAKFTVHETTGIRVVFAGFNAGDAAARRRAGAAGAAARRRPQGDPRQHHGGLGGAGARRPGARRVRLQGHAARPPVPVRSREGQGAPGPGRLDAGPRRHHAEGRPAAVALVAGRARPLSQGRRDHRGDPGDVQGRRRRGQGAGARVGRGVPAGPRQPAQPPHVHARLGDVQRRRRLLALRALPQQAGAADRLEHLALRQPAGGHARGAGAPQPEPDRAREALRRGAGHPRQGDGVDPGLHDQGDHRLARRREGLSRSIRSSTT